MACIAALDLCMGQNSALRFFMTVKDQAGELVDINGATEITFSVWLDADAGALQFTKTFTGATIQKNNDHQFNFLVTTTDSAIDAAVYYCEAWITNSDSEPQPVGKGNFEIEETRQGD